MTTIALALVFEIYIGEQLYIPEVSGGVSSGAGTKHIGLYVQVRLFTTTRKSPDGKTRTILPT